MQVFLNSTSKDYYATDLVWQILDPFEDKLFSNHQIKGISANGGRLFAKFKNGSDVNYGVAPDFDEDTPKGVKVFSLAARVATAKRFQSSTCLVLLNDPEFVGTAYAIGLVSGNVILDERFGIESAAQIHGKFRDICESSRRVFHVHGDVVIGDIANDHSYSMAELLADNSAKKSRLVAIKNDRALRVALSALAVVVCISLSYKAWDFFSTAKLQEQEDRRAKEGQPTYMYSKSVAFLLASDRLIGANVGLQIVTQLGAFPARLGGWSIRSIECIDVQCKARWHSDGGTFEDFKALAHKDWGRLDFSSNERNPLGELKDIHHTFTLNLTKTKLQPPAQWPSSEEFIYQTGLDWQRLNPTGWSAVLSSLELQALPIGVNAITVKGQADAIWAMPWSSTNTDWWVARQVITKLKPNFEIQKFALNVDTKTNALKFSISGIAYVKKLPSS